MRKPERLPDPVLLAQAAFYVMAAATALGLGVALGFQLDDPATITQTRTLDPLPACREIAADLQAERARVDDVDVAVAAVDAELAQVDDVFLTRDEDKITAHAKVVDEAMRAAQAADQDLVTAQAALDARIAACAPERDS